MWYYFTIKKIDFEFYDHEILKEYNDITIIICMNYYLKNTSFFATKING